MCLGSVNPVTVCAAWVDVALLSASWNAPDFAAIQVEE
jgi:hypothetical protein